MPESSHFHACEPLKGIAPYVGGKRILAGRIIKVIDAVPHRTYAEVFVGMGGVFFRRTRAPSAEIVNDLSSDVATLFRVLQRHYLAFVEMLRWQLTTRAEFERLVACDPATLTDLERAARFFYLQVLAFGGKPSGRNFGVEVTTSGAFDVTRLVPQLEAYHLRLAGVTIERLPYGEFLPRYDREGTLFYLDPPYFGSEHFYGRDLFGRDDFERLAGLLSNLKGRFVMSLNDHPDVRRIFGRFKLQSVPVNYTVAGGKHGRKPRRELIITDGR